MMSVTTVIKAKDTAHAIPSIFHKTRQLNIQSLELRLVKLSYLVGSAGRNNVYFHMG